jgi:glycerophosphoryl diester phosphodiesterase
MVKFIAHRGNTQGIRPELENTIGYLESALGAGHMVECDLQMQKGVLYLGHDELQEIAPLDLITDPRVFCHAKDIPALLLLSQLNAHCFWHQTDTVTITSNGYIWCYPGVFPAHKKAIWLWCHTNVQATLPDPKARNIYAICGDHEDMLR